MISTTVTVICVFFVHVTVRENVHVPVTWRNRGWSSPANQTNHTRFTPTPHWYKPVTLPDHVTPFGCLLIGRPEAVGEERGGGGAVAGSRRMRENKFLPDYYGDESTAC